MNHTPPPTIRIIDQGINVRFPPQKHWGFVSCERFELRIDTEVSMSQLRHHHAQLTDVSLTVSMRDLETLIQSRLERSSFKEVHLIGAKSKTTGQPTPLMCWGIFQPAKQRQQLFYLEGGFHALAHSLRFEFYQGILFGLGELSAQSLAARLLKEAGLPAQRTHPTVLNLDPLTELSLAYCLDWGWKLPKRKLASEIDISAQEISFISGKTRDAYLLSSFDPTANKITSQQEIHLNLLRKFHEGEGLIHAEEYESAKIFFKSHSEEPPAAIRYFELSRWLGEPEEYLKSWCQSANLTPSDSARAQALIAEDSGDYQSATDHWTQFIEAELEVFRNATISTPTERSPLSLSILRGLKDYTLGLLNSDHDPSISLTHLEAARSQLGVSCYLLSSIAQNAIKCNDTILAQARLTECAQHQALLKQFSAAANTWVQLGELWINDPEGYDNAERAFRKALEIDPTALAPYYSLAHLNELRGDLIAAKSLLERILELSPYTKRARDILNRLALELEQPLRDAPSSNDSSISYSEITRLPQETQDRLAPVPSPAPIQLETSVSTDSKKEPSLTPPPRPLSAGPFAQPDPWSLAPKEGLDDWLNEQESQSEPESPLIHQNSMDVVNLDEEAELSEDSESSSHSRITASPHEKKNEKETAQPKSVIPISEPSDPNYEVEEPKSPSSERITLPPPSDEEQRVPKASNDDTRKPPVPPRAATSPLQWNSSDFDAINAALSLAHPQKDSGTDHAIVKTSSYTPVKDKETRPPSSERSTVPPSSSDLIDTPQPSALLDTQEDESLSVQPQRDLPQRLNTEESKPAEYLQNKRQRMEASLNSILSKEEAQNKLNQLETELDTPEIDQETQAHLALEIAIIYRDQLLDIPNAKAWFWDGLKRSPNDNLRYELNESLAELYTVTQDWEGLLEYYLFIAKQKWSDPDEAHLQRASLLKTLERPLEAITACEEALSALDEESSVTRSIGKQDRYEETLRLKADLLTEQDQHEIAVDLLIQHHDQLELNRSALRHAYAARILKNHDQERAATLYQIAYNESPSETLLDEWLSHANHWGDAYARASAVRASVKANSNLQNTRVSSRRLAQLADEVHINTPLLSIELYQESLDQQLDLDIAERLINISEQRDQFQSLAHGLNLLIPECFEGEYRGLLKLKRGFTLYILRDESAGEAILDAMLDFDGAIASREEFELLLGWAETRCQPNDYHQVLTWLDSVGAFGTPTPSEPS